LDSNNKIANLFKNSFDELVFKNRNKAYGAYQLRILSRKNYVLGFAITMAMFVPGFFIVNSFKTEKPFKETKLINYEIFNPNIKLAPIKEIEPPKGDPKASDIKETKNKEEKKSKEIKDPDKKLDPTKIAKESKDIKEKALQDSLNKLKLDSIALKKTNDSLAAIANGKGKMGLENGTGEGIDTTQHKVIGGNDQFVEWLAAILRNKYTKEFKEYGRSVTFTLGYVINSDSTMTDVKIYQKAYFGMDEVVLETIKANPKKWIPYKNERGLIIQRQAVKTPVKLLPLVNNK
jgi:periplasmic protein TonB